MGLSVRLFLFAFPTTLLASSALSPAPTPTLAERGQAVFESGRSARQIPIEVGSSGLLFVRARVSGTPFWFLLDTGSPSIFGERQAIQLGLPIEGGAPGAANGEKKSSTGLLPNLTVELPGVRVTQPTVSSFDVAPLQTALGHAVDGILGTSFFDRFVVAIDFEAQVLNLHEPADYRPRPKGTFLPISLEGGLPYVEATITWPGHSPLTGQFLIDTGADSAVLLYSSFVDTHGLLGSATKAPESAMGAEAENLEAVSRAESLRIAHFVLRQPLVTLSRSTRGGLADTRHAGLIGAEVLRRFQIVVDYSHKRMTLRKNGHSLEPFDYDASGLTLHAQGPDLSTFEVRRVLPGSPGAEAGLQAGDVLLALDRRPVKEVTLHGIRRLFRADGKEYALSVFRQGRILQLRLKCRRLL